MTDFYKVLGPNGECIHGGTGSWPLPQGNEPGAWMPKIEGELKFCKRGYHVLRFEHLVRWLGPTIWRVEIAGEVLEDADKCLVRTTRLVSKIEQWNEKTARLFAADCAEHVLHFFEEKYPGASRPRAAIQAARDFANGLITEAARAAAGDAAWAAAGAAEQQWQTERLRAYLT